MAERRDIADLDTVFVRFENGVRLTVKPTKFSNSEILVQARVGHGELDLPSDRASPAWAASAAFPEGGLDQITAQDLEQVLRSKILGKSFTITEDAFVLSGETRPEDLDAQLQLLAAYVAHPGMAAGGVPAHAQRRPGHSRPDEGHAGGGPEPRPRRPCCTPATAAGVSRAARRSPRNSRPTLKAMLAPDLAHGPIEVVIVGDTTVDKAIDAVAATFGALPARPEAATPPVISPKAAFPAGTPSPVMLTHTGRFDQAIGLIAWPTEDFLSDTQRSRNLALLGEVLQLRLTEKLRKAEGVTYSPQAAATPSQVFANYGYLSARVEIPPLKLDGFFSDVAVIVTDLRSHDIGADELERAKKPAVDDLERRRQTNEYWLNALADAQTDPRRLGAIRSSVAQLQHVSAYDIRRAAEDYLVDSKAFKLEVKPSGAP